MGVLTYEREIHTAVPPAKMFKALAIDGNDIVAKILPQAIKNIVNLEGDGGPGTIKQINFDEGTGYRYVKERVDAIDKENFTYAYSIFEGDPLTNKFEKVSYEVKFEASPEGGSICRSSTKYYTIEDNEINTEEIKSDKERSMGVFKAIETYLLENPDA